MKDALAGSDRLLRLALRRDRVLVPVWIVALAFSCASSARATVDLYPHVADRVAMAEGLNLNPALVGLYGPITDVRSLGAVATFKLLLFGGVFVAMLAVVLVRRHTRSEEESGRAELLMAAAVGRHALLAAAVAEGVLASILVGVLTAAGNAAVGLDVAGSVAFGLAWTGLGLSATGITALAAQVFASTRSVAAMVAGLLGAAYVVRAVGDVSAGWLTWLSPFGWASRVDAYGDIRWWVLLLPVLALVGTTTGAVLLAARRDVGSGLFADRAGPARGTLTSMSGLDLRQHRAALVGWSLALAGLGAVLGGIAPGAEKMLGSQQVADMLERLGGSGRPIDTFLATELSFLAVGVTAFATTVVARAATEEDEGRTAEVLAAGARTRLLASTTALITLAPVLLLLVFAVATSLVLGPQVDGIGAALGDLVPASLAQLPAVWVVAGAALLLYGVRRSWAVHGWTVLAAFLTLGQLGKLLGLPDWLVGISPYSHIPSLPTESLTVVPELVLTLVAAGLVALAFWRFSERDVG